MVLQSLTLRNYRSYELASFELGRGVTIVIGPNASGKTNLLEAAFIACQGTSFRVSDKDLIRNGAEWARIDAVFDNDERTIKLIHASPRAKKTFTINDTEKPRLTFQQTIPLVLFEPDDIRIIGGSPERRREYLDGLLSRTFAEYKQALTSYKRAHRQRNVLLKTKGSQSALFALDVIMARHAEIVVRYRIDVMDSINAQISELYQAIAGRKDTVRLTYSLLDASSYASHFMRKMEQNRLVDLEKGYTSFGPHRDDFTITINDCEASKHASRGEARTVTLALKIIEMLLIEKQRNIKPLLLLDDVFSELDGTRRRTLTEYLKDHQCIITTTDADVVDKRFAKLSSIISI